MSKDQASLFDYSAKAKNRPFVDQARPKLITDFMGFEQMSKSFPNLFCSDFLGAILHGPPGTGKTTFAYLLCQHRGWHFESMSAITSGVKELKQAIDDFSHFHKKCVLFIDEIHRLSKPAQDVLLPGIESGKFILIGATTENPKSILTKALLSRSLLVPMPKLTTEQLKNIYQRLYRDYKIIPLATKIEDTLVHFAQGDGRRAITHLELFLDIKKTSQETEDVVLELLLPHIKNQGHVHDRAGSAHYDTISAFIKSMRASDSKAALAYLCLMLAGNEDPLFIARRMVIFASEDIGLADPLALSVAMNVHLAVEKIGLPECGINLAHGVCYLANAKKDTTSYQAYLQAQEFIKSKNDWNIPVHLKNVI